MGILPANVLRSYWWRFNGWGYAAGIFGGMLMSLGRVIGDNDLWRTPLPLCVGFPVIALASTVISIVVALLPKPMDEPTLARFYQTVQPAGGVGLGESECALSESSVAPRSAVLMRRT